MPTFGESSTSVPSTNEPSRSVSRRVKLTVGVVCVFPSLLVGWLSAQGP